MEPLFWKDGARVLEAGELPLFPDFVFDTSVYGH